MNVAHELLRENVVKRGIDCAVLHEESRITYQELAENVGRYGNFLLGQGLRPRARIVIQLPDCPECLYAFLGSIQAGLWPVLISPDLGREGRDFILHDAQAEALLTNQEPEAGEPGCRAVPLRLNVAEAANQRALATSAPGLDPYPAHADDIAFLLYSSGSTGHPKGVPHRHRDMLFCADAYGANVLRITDEDIHFSASKLFFAYGLGNSLFLPFRFGAATVLHSGKPTPTDVFRIIARRKPSLFFGVPALYSMLVKTFDATATLDSLRLCVSAGEALPAALFEEWKRLTGLEILDGIGSTEALHIFISNRPGEARPGTSGCAVPSYEAKVVTEAGRPVTMGEPGSLVIRGGSSAPYYWSRPDKTVDTMLRGGWLKTGDIYVERDGYFTYQGRGDDMFKVDARWVSPVQVEEVLRQHPAVRDCGVTWRRLEGLIKPVAHLVLNPDYKAGLDLEKELRLFARARLPDYACPVQVYFQRALPRTDTGKLQRFRLREVRASDSLYDKNDAGTSDVENHKPAEPVRPMKTTTADIMDVLKQAGIQQTIINQLKPDLPLLQQGLDSIDLPAIAAATEQRFKIDLSDADAGDLKTINDYVRFVNGKLK